MVEEPSTLSREERGVFAPQLLSQILTRMERFRMLDAASYPMHSAILLITHFAQSSLEEVVWLKVKDF